MYAVKIVKYHPRYKTYESAQITGVLRVNYLLNDWTYPDPDLLASGYGLCVFDKLKFALDFYDQDIAINMQSWLCEVDEFMPLKFQRHWILVQEPKELPYAACCGMAWPEGTQMVARLKLLRKIEVQPLLDGVLWNLGPDCPDVRDIL